MPRVDIHERRVVSPTLDERRHQLQLLERDNRAALHPRAGANFGAVAQDDRAAFHLQTDEVLGLTADDNQSTPHS